VKRIILCADDYGFSPGVSKAIRDLIARGRLNATSAMTIFPGFAEEAKALLDTPSPAPVQIGLHLTLTGGYAPLTAPPVATRDGKLPALNALLSPFARFRIDRKALDLEIAAQLDAFISAFGRLPDFVDGHQHVHLMPGIRKCFLKEVTRIAPNAWVRQCGPAKMRDLITADNKTRVIGALNFAFRRQAARMGLKTNPSFTGAYSFAGPDKFSGVFPRFLDELTDGGVMMCHPGFADAILRERDTLVDRRDEEYAFLAGDDFNKVMKAAGATLA
jgi:predicted glycoside hydrolase/deacetylase ChbG (UPF0249 family)